MTPFVWMFISSYEQLCSMLINEETISTLIQLEYSGFDGATVPICTFTLTKGHTADFIGSYIKLSDFKGHQNQAPKSLEAIKKPDCGWFYRAKQDDFKKIPGSPIAYWVSDKVRDIFSNSPALGGVADAAVGLQTGDNDRFLRLWHEVKLNGIGFGMENREQAQQSGMKWFPYNKGGQFRKWYGNQEFVVNWQNDGEEIRGFVDDKGKQRSRPQNTEYYFKSSVSWSDVTSSDISFRFFPKGFIYDVKGQSAFIDNEDLRLNILTYCNNKFISFLSKIINPSLSFQVGNFNQLPFAENIPNIDIKFLINQSKTDWNTYETSWDFQNNPLINTVGWVSDSVTQQSEAKNAGLRDKAANPADIKPASFPPRTVGTRVF
jgi:hypothetical protein